MELFLALTKCPAVKSKLIQYFTNLDYEMNLEQVYSKELLSTREQIQQMKNFIQANLEDCPIPVPVWLNEDSLKTFSQERRVGSLNCSHLESSKSIEYSTA